MAKTEQRQAASETSKIVNEGRFERLTIRTEKWVNIISESTASADFILIGDVPGPNADTDVPFADYTGFSAGWLNRQLDDWCIHEKNLVWLNTQNRVSPYRTGKKQLNILNSDLLVNVIPDRFERPVVVALGGNAKKWCDRLASRYAIDYEFFPHPSYWRRFKSQEQYPLLEFLQQKIYYS